MKTFSKNSLMVLILLCGGCSTTSPEYDYDMCVLIDLTDPLTIRPDATHILSFLRLYEQQWIGARVRITFISDKDINAETVITLDKENALLGNSQMRSAGIEYFEEALRSHFALLDTASTFGHSIIYRAVARELSTLSASVSPKRHLLIYSNMIENSEDVNLYDSTTVSVLATAPDSIAEKLKRQVLLPDLSGINIWVLHTPATYEENKTYTTLSRFWSGLFTGAEIHFQSGI